MRGLVLGGAASTLVLALGGCVSDKVAQYGGVERPFAAAETTPCETADIELVNEAEIVVPLEAVPAFHDSRSVGTLDQMAIVYDVTRDGKAANIRYNGVANALNTESGRALIRVMADQVGSFEYAWRGRPSHAQACRYSLAVETS